MVGSLGKDYSGSLSYAQEKMTGGFGCWFSGLRSIRTVADTENLGYPTQGPLHCSRVDRAHEGA